MKPTLDVDEDLNGVVAVLRDEGDKFCERQRTGRESRFSAETKSLMAQRRDTTDAAKRVALTRLVRKSIRRDLRRANTLLVKEAIERNKDSKVFSQQLGRSHLTKLKTAEGKIVTSKLEVLAETESFYGKLYATHAPQLAPTHSDPRAPPTRHYTDELPEISLEEIELALRQLKNGKAPGEDGITTELLKAGGEPLLRELQRIFNSVLLTGRTPEAWHSSIVVLFFKKGDKTLLKNYRPISLLSHVYKLFSRVITNHLARRLDDYQPPEQAGFRGGFSTVDHIHTVRQVIQKTGEYNQPLCLAFVDYEKAFDSIETWAVLESLQRCQIYWRYVEVLRCHNVRPNIRQSNKTNPAP